jgi:hypothetical protein
MRRKSIKVRSIQTKFGPTEREFKFLGIKLERKNQPSFVISIAKSSMEKNTRVNETI